MVGIFGGIFNYIYVGCIVRGLGGGNNGGADSSQLEI